MKANELRIGNYLCFSEDKIIKVFEIQENCFYAKSENNDEFKDTCFEIKPIPLTEEWLLKFGFEKGSNIIGDCYYIERDFGVSDFVLNITKTSNFKIYELDLKIDYVHQLQNLYFSLTSEELIVNL